MTLNPNAVIAVVVIVIVLTAIACMYVGVKMERAANRSAVRFASVTNGRSYTRFAHKNDHLGE